MTSTTSIGQPGGGDRNDDTPSNDRGQRTLGETGEEERQANGGPVADRHALTEKLLLDKLEQAQRERNRN